MPKGDNEIGLPSETFSFSGPNNLSSGSLPQSRATFWKYLFLSFISAAAIAFFVVLIFSFTNGGTTSGGDNHDDPVYPHPFDGLNADEIALITEILAAEGNPTFGFGFRMMELHLHEPPKETMKNWVPNTPFTREARVILRSSERKVYEAIVSLNTNDIISMKELPNVQPMIRDQEVQSIAEVILKSDRLMNAVRARGLNPNHVHADINSAGVFDNVPMDRRVVHLEFYYTKDIINFWARPLNMNCLVDMDTGEVLEWYDFPSPLAPAQHSELNEEAQPKIRDFKPIEFLQPEGVNFNVRGGMVNWQKWSYHVRLDQRVGAVISNISYADDYTPDGTPRERLIVWQWYLAEMLVPYMDMNPVWSFKSYFDAGEYGIGQLSASLIPGQSCPENSHYFDAIFADENGQPFTIPKAACLFERWSGGTSWTHLDGDKMQEARKDVELVLRQVAVVSNYDYTIEMVLKLDGTIKYRVGASGMDAMKGSNSTTARPDGDESLISEHIAAPYHDHYFNFRIDFDVDGPQNSFVVETLRKNYIGSPDTPTVSPMAANTRMGRRMAGLEDTWQRTSYWDISRSVATTEGEAKRNIDIRNPTTWKVVNPDLKSRIGNTVGYELRPGSNAVSLLAADDAVAKRSHFLDYHLWVTPFDANERYPAGDFPNQNTNQNDGLPKWTEQNRPINGTDIVLWYNLSFHHVTRQEDFPILPMHWGEFELKPYNFFDRNPALDLPSKM